MCVCVCVCTIISTLCVREEETEMRQEGEKSRRTEEKSAHYITLARLPITPLKTFRALPQGYVGRFGGRLNSDTPQRHITN